MARHAAASPLEGGRGRKGHALASKLAQRLNLSTRSHTHLALDGVPRVLQPGVVVGVVQHQALLQVLLGVVAHLLRVDEEEDEEDELGQEDDQENDEELRKEEKKEENLSPWVGGGEEPRGSAPPPCCHSRSAAGTCSP